MVYIYHSKQWFVHTPIYVNIVVNHGLKTVVYNYGMHTMCFAAGKLLQSMVYMCAIVHYGVLICHLTM